METERMESEKVILEDDEVRGKETENDVEPQESRFPSGNNKRKLNRSHESKKEASEPWYFTHL